MPPPRIHIAHITPNLARGHFPYREIIETLIWGLQQLGYTVSHAFHGMDAGATNIVVGWHMLGVEEMRRLPQGTILYSLEQMRHITSAESMLESVRFGAANFQLWDYSAAHVPIWNLTPLRYPVRILPVAYAPVLTRIAKSAVQDIDVFFYGTPGRERLGIFRELNDAGLYCIFACGCYGEARDAYIARAKIVLNIGAYRAANHFEVVRAGYLLANSKAIVAEINPEMFVEADLRDGVSFVPLDRIAAECASLAGDDARRLELERRGLEVFARRDIRVLLQSALK